MYLKKIVTSTSNFEMNISNQIYILIVSVSTQQEMKHTCIYKNIDATTRRTLPPRPARAPTSTV